MVNLCNGGTTDFAELLTSDHFFVSQMKKNLSKTTSKKTLSSKEMLNRHKEQCIRNKCLSDYIYSLATL